MNELETFIRSQIQKKSIELQTKQKELSVLINQRHNLKDSLEVKNREIGEMVGQIKKINEDIKELQAQQSKTPEGKVNKAKIEKEIEEIKKEAQKEMEKAQRRNKLKK